MVEDDRAVLSLSFDRSYFSGTWRGAKAPTVGLGDVSTTAAVEWNGFGGMVQWIGGVALIPATDRRESRSLRWSAEGCWVVAEHEDLDGALP